MADTLVSTYCTVCGCRKDDVVPAESAPTWVYPCHPNDQEDRTIHGVVT